MGLVKPPRPNSYMDLKFDQYTIKMQYCWYPMTFFQNRKFKITWFTYIFMLKSEKFFSRYNEEYLCNDKVTDETLEAFNVGLSSVNEKDIELFIELSTN